MVVTLSDEQETTTALRFVVDNKVTGANVLCEGAGRADRVSQVYWDCRKTMKHRAGIAPGEAFEAAYRQMR